MSCDSGVELQPSQTTPPGVPGLCLTESSSHSASFVCPRDGELTAVITADGASERPSGSPPGRGQREARSSQIPLCCKRKRKGEKRKDLKSAEEHRRDKKKRRYVEKSEGDKRFPSPLLQITCRFWYDMGSTENCITNHRALLPPQIPLTVQHVSHLRSQTMGCHCSQSH